MCVGVYGLHMEMDEMNDTNSGFSVGEDWYVGKMSECQKTLISDDLKAEILSRLPAKTLCKIRCVSKQWLRIITDPYFVNIHRIRFRQNPPLLLHVSCAIVRHGFKKFECQQTLHLSTMDKEGTFYGEFNLVIHGGLLHRLLPCCNLICLLTSRQIYICNPSTQQLLRLPLSSLLPPQDIEAVGFGYLPAINTYKIVHTYIEVIIPSELNKIQCEVFTLTDGAGGHWRLIEECPYLAFHSMSPVCVNGAIYWTATDMKDRLGKNIILAFDLEKESFYTISYPDFISLAPYLECLLELKGCLCLTNWTTFVRRKGRSDPLVMEIWMLKDHKKHVWIREYVIDFSVYDGDYDFIHDYTPLEEQDGELLIDSHRNYLCYYNIQGKYFRRARNFNSEGFNRSSCLYFDGLFSLKS